MSAQVPDTNNVLGSGSGLFRIRLEERIACIQGRRQRGNRYKPWRGPRVPSLPSQGVQEATLGLQGVQLVTVRACRLRTASVAHRTISAHMVCCCRTAGIRPCRSRSSCTPAASAAAGGGGPRRRRRHRRRRWEPAWGLVLGTGWVPGWGMAGARGWETGRQRQEWQSAPAWGSAGATERRRGPAQGLSLLSVCLSRPGSARGQAAARRGYLRAPALAQGLVPARSPRPARTGGRVHRCCDGGAQTLPQRAAPIEQLGSSVCILHKLSSLDVMSHDDDVTSSQAPACHAS